MSQTNEKPIWRVWSVQAADVPCYEYSAAHYYLRRGPEVVCHVLRTDRAYTVEEVTFIAHADCDERNAPPKPTFRPWRELLKDLLCPDKCAEIQAAVEQEIATLNADASASAQPVRTGKVLTGGGDLDRQFKVETNEQLIARLAPEYEACSFAEADPTARIDASDRRLCIVRAAGVWRTAGKALGGNGFADPIWLRKKQPVRKTWGPWEQCFEGEEPARNGKGQFAKLFDHDKGWDLLYSNTTPTDGEYCVRLAAQPMRTVSVEEISKFARDPKNGMHTSEVARDGFTAGVIWREELARKEAGK